MLFSVEAKRVVSALKIHRAFEPCMIVQSSNLRKAPGRLLLSEAAALEILHMSHSSAGHADQSSVPGLERHAVKTMRMTGWCYCRD